MQRVLAAEDEATARRGAIWGAWLKLSAVFLFIVPGMIALGLANRGRLDLAEADQACPSSSTRCCRWACAASSPRACSRP